MNDRSTLLNYVPEPDDGQHRSALMGVVQATLGLVTVVRDFPSDRDDF
jgi:hypothetical protein